VAGTWELGVFAPWLDMGFVGVMGCFGVVFEDYIGVCHEMEILMFV
jgi:hypothetical protein